MIACGVHVPTLLMAATLQLVMLVGVGFPTWRRAGGPGVTGRVLGAPFLSTLALVLFGQRGAWSGALTIVLPNALLLVAHQLWLGAVYRICGMERATRHLEYAVAATGVAGVALLWGIDGSAGSLGLAKPRVVVSTLPMVVTGVYWLRALFRSTPRPWPLGRRYLLWAAALAIAQNVARITDYLTSPGTLDPLASQGSAGPVVLMNLVGVFSGVGLLMEVEARSRAALVHANDRLVTDALTDPLTALGNRRRLEQQSEALVGSARRNGWPVSVMLLDLDHFKAINDRWGHAAGDDVLRATARLCSDALREHDVLVRWGGEEFAIVLPRCDLAAAERIAERIHTALRTTSVAPPGGAPVTASIGIALHQHDEASFVDAMNRADAAMYRAKTAGRNRSEVHREALA